MNFILCATLRPTMVTRKYFCILYINLIKWLHWHFWWHFKKISNFKKKKKNFFLVGIDDGKFIVLTDNEGKLNKYLFCTTILKLDLQKIINCYRFVYLLFWCLWQAAKWKKERKKRKITSIQRHEKWNECITLLSTSSIPTSQLWLLSCNSIFHLLTFFFVLFSIVFGASCVAYSYYLIYFHLIDWITREAQLTVFFFLCSTPDGCA